MKRKKTFFGNELQAIKDDKGKYPHGAVEGYASTWDIDRAGERFVKGAFAKTIAERVPTGRIKLLDSHNMYGPASQTTIGKIAEAHEDNHGLYIVAPFASTIAAQEMRKLVIDGIIKDFSVGGRIIQEDFNDKDRCVDLKECMLFETSLVNEPCNEHANILGVKALNERTDLFEIAASDTPFDEQGARTRFLAWCKKNCLSAVSGGFLYMNQDGDDQELLFPLVDIINDQPRLIPAAIVAASKAIKSGTGLPLSSKDLAKALDPFVIRTKVSLDEPPPAPPVEDLANEFADFLKSANLSLETLKLRIAMNR